MIPHIPVILNNPEGPDYLCCMHSIRAKHWRTVALNELSLAPLLYRVKQSLSPLVYTEIAHFSFKYQRVLKEAR